MPEALLKVKNLSKKFSLNGVNSKNHRKPERSEFFALRDISFDLNRGDVIGVIGENGSGKSTLLKIISEIIPPTSGTIEYFGRVTSILEMGTGFHPDLTGKENVFLNGAMLGMSISEISGKYEQIVAFSGIGSFIHTQVKHYSTGMYVRLAFSVSVLLETEILLLDEIVTVGDAEFRLKSLDKLREKVKSGISVVLVSHNLNEVIDLCNKCILLKEGRIAGIGDPVKITREYYQEAVTEHLNTINSVQKIFKKKKVADAKTPDSDNHSIQFLSSIAWNEITKAPGNDKIKLTEVSVNATGKQPAEKIFYNNPVEINIRYRNFSNDHILYVYITLFDQLDNPVFISGTLPVPPGTLKTEPGMFHTQIAIPGNWLNYGLFSLGITFASGSKDEIVARFPKLIYFNILPDERETNGYLNYYTPGPLRPKLEWRTRKIE